MNIYNKKYLDIDVFAFLEEKMNINTKYYQSDFEIDKEIIVKAAESNRKEDKTLLWLSRANGTQCVKECEAFIRDSGAYITWQYYASESSDHPIIACAIEITGLEDGVVIGNVYDLDYLAHAAEVEKRAVVPLEYEKTFEDGFVAHVPFDRSSSGYYQPLIEEHGTIVDSLALPCDKEKLAFVLADQKRERGRLTVGDWSKGKWKIWFKTFDDTGKLTGGGVLPNEYEHKSSALRHIKKLDQDHHRWIVSKKNPWEKGDSAKDFISVQTIQDMENDSLPNNLAKENEKDGYFILSIEECCDEAFGASIVQYGKKDGFVGFAFSSVDAKDAIAQPELVLNEIINKENNFVAPAWCELSDSMLNLVVDSGFDMHFIEFDDQDWTKDKADAIWQESIAKGLDSVVTSCEDDCWISVYAGAMCSVNWSNHPEFGKPCLENVLCHVNNESLEEKIGHAKPQNEDHSLDVTSRSNRQPEL